MWRVVVDPSVVRQTARFPKQDRERIFEAINRMADGPFAGDIKNLGRGEYRRRVGSHRIFYEVRREEAVVVVASVVRRTSTTY
jgi:mRNA-degrading endonuclease RelE of RelBE toxin-antitoxin system